MAKYIPDTKIDDELDAIISTATRLFICSTQPTTYAEASATYCLATIVIDSSDFTKADGDAGGRKVTLGAQTGTVSADGTAAHYALGVAVGSVLLLVGTLTGQALVTGNTVNFPATDVLEIGDPS